MKTVKILFIIIICTKCLFAQKIRPIDIGDSIPHNFVLGKSTKYKGKTILSDFKGKLVILDFWASYCQACINALPKLQKLQDKYADRIQILVVTSEDLQKVNSLLKRSEITKNESITLPFITEDSILKKTFPHIIIPHEVIIDSDRKIIALTSESELTDHNIKKLLAGEKTTLALKDDFGGSHSSSNDKLDDTNVIWSSSLKDGGLGRGSLSRYDDDRFIKSVNLELTPIGMFYTVFSYFKLGLMAPINSQRVFVEVKDSVVYKRYANKKLSPLPFFPRHFPYLNYSNRQEYDKDNVKTYNLKLPYGVPDSIVFNIIFDDLNRYFPIKARIEKRTIPTVVVRKGNSGNILQPSSCNKRTILTADSIGVLNQPIEKFFNLFKYFINAEPLINETGIDYPVNIVIDFHDSSLRDPRNGLIINNKFDVKLFKETLEKYGFVVNIEPRLVDVLVVYD
ncbi:MULTISPECIES: TlpA family protein disulfide reductase [Olivibacter]|uniref:TlpA family protein disulfide reductase n=1 Tax=Olivibacter oleidegradans TaxID=760123 RepID=A0ABV6HIF2_9SPHI|nr:TlpA disulfide reductase family protein [Olivibacter jilunii]